MNFGISTKMYNTKIGARSSDTFYVNSRTILTSYLTEIKIIAAQFINVTHIEKGVLSPIHTDYANASLIIIYEYNINNDNYVKYYGNKTIFDTRCNKNICNFNIELNEESKEHILLKVTNLTDSSCNYGIFITCAQM
jgi:hypothetical protein